MTSSEAQLKIFETYNEEEFFNAKHEPDTGTFTGSATVTTLYGTEGHAIRRRVKRAFHDVGHGKKPVDALANARRVLGLEGSA